MRKQYFFIIALVIFALGFTKLTKAAYYTNQVSSSYRNIGTPEGILVLSNGDFWYADSQNYRVVKMNSGGEVLRTIGRQGTGEGEFEDVVKDITQDGDGNVYVLDYCHVTVLDQYGGYKSHWGSCGGGLGEFSNAVGIRYSSHDNQLLISDTGHHRILRYTTDGTYISEFGSFGSGNGELNEPWGLTVDGDGNTYVVDGTNHRIEVFNHADTYVRDFGSSDAGDFELYFPKDVEVLADGSIVVASQNTQRIKKFNSTGTALLKEWGSNGSGNEQFTSPQYLAIAPDGSLWVSDWGLKRLQHFQDDGTFIGIIANSGATNGLFTTPYAVDFDASGNIYVFDSTGRVQKFNSSGTYISTPIAANTVAEGSMYHMAIDRITGNIYLSSDYNVTAFTSEGVYINTLGNHGANGSAGAPGDFNHARGMAFDSNGYLYVTDLLNDRVQKFNVSNIADGAFDGGYMTEWTVDYPEYITIDDSDAIYVSSPEPQMDDSNPQAVRKYNTSGVFDSIYLDGFGESSEQYYKIAGITLHGGKTYIADPHVDRNRIQVYNASGTYLETIGSEGSGNEQFSGIRYARFNPVTDDLVVVDSLNHRVQILVDGVKIKNLISSADVINTTSSTSLTKKAVDPTTPGVDSLTAELYFGDYVVSDFTVNLSSDRDWAEVNTILLPEESKSLVVHLNPTDAPGVSNTHSLYIVKQSGQDSVRVCPDAVAIADVNSSCTNGYVLRVGDDQLSTETIGSIEYWKVTGLTGTGGLGESPVPTSTPTPTPTSTNRTSSSTNTSSSNGTPSPTYCGEEMVSGTPDLFQINVEGTSAKIFFTPVSNTNRYYVSFSTSPQAEEHGAEVDLAREGVQNYTISHLSPGRTYYFKVRGQKGCRAGEWSNIMEAQVGSKGMISTLIYYKSVFTHALSSLFKQDGPSTPPPPETVEFSVSQKKIKHGAVPTAPKTAPVGRTCRQVLWWCL